MNLQDLITLIPVLLLALGGTLLLMVGAWWNRPRPIFAAGVVLALAAAAHATWVVPSVPAAGGMFLFDAYGRFFTAVWSMVGALTLMMSVRYAQERRFGAGEYVSLVLFGAAGMALLSASSSLAGLFLGLESFTLVLYILIAFHPLSDQGGEAGLKYLVMGATATGFLAFAVALLYAASGSFEIGAAMQAVTGPDGARSTLALLGWAMLLVAAAFKISLAPLHLWTPDVYQGAPAPVTALLSTGSKGAVLAALLPLWRQLPGTVDPVVEVLQAACLFSMLVGTFCALRQDNLKRMLAYSSVVHMGYAVLALLAGGDVGASALVFYLLVYSLAILGIFGVLCALAGRDEEIQHLEALQGLGHRRPLAAAALSLCLLSLAGIPPAAGFLGKFGIFYAALKADLLFLALAGILTSLISLYFYLGPIVRMYMVGDSATQYRTLPAPCALAVGFCCAGLLVLGFYPSALLDYIARMF